ncbi:uncharacterized protein LOC111089124 [Limulus polyphemus]|uniref:Uncharacterized protein LOC111089124 n=1 Tax=Limulus polyphemus TaxID=6850 RepID=A0ABM1TLD5_LIMPO|nr:uncharacterized protein LOC111089124 [Limulus polyphemus]
MFKVDSDKEFDLEDEDFFQDIFKVSSMETSPGLLKKHHNSSDRGESIDGQQLNSHTSMPSLTIKGTEKHTFSFQQRLGSEGDGQQIPFTVQKGKDNRTCDRIFSKNIYSKLLIESRNSPESFPVCDQKHKSEPNHPISVFENVNTTFTNIPQTNSCSMRMETSIEDSTSNQLSHEELDFLSLDLDFDDSFALEGLSSNSMIKSNSPEKTISTIPHNTITQITVTSTNHSVDKKPAFENGVCPKKFSENCNKSPVLISHETTLQPKENLHLTPIMNKGHQRDESLEAISKTVLHHSSSLLNPENNKSSSKKENQVFSSISAVHQPKLHNSHLRQEGNDTPLSRKPRKRKFPGPAGLLPNLQLGQSVLEFSALDSPVPEKSPVIPTAIELPNSQTVEEEFTKVPWTNMLNDLEISESDPNSILNFNISWIVRKARTKQLPNGKVPVLVVLIKEIDVKGAEASVTFRDRTGEIQGTIHRKLVEEYQMYLKPGCVLVLKQAINERKDKSSASTSVSGSSPVLFNTAAGFIPGVSTNRRITTPQKPHSASWSDSAGIPKHEPPRLLPPTQHPAIIRTPRSQIQPNCVTESNLTKCKSAVENISSKHQNVPAKHCFPSQCVGDMTKKNIIENRKITCPVLNPEVSKFKFKTFNRTPDSLMSTKSYPFTVENEEGKHPEEHFLVEDELDHLLKNLDDETLLSTC